ncbi:unnamed protein product [Clavelina lepadiformis]|uniref:Protein kinase domain-containing protein n=1 Tax=Clavelina lepadiformis TaxID=159417 RepID=A0ABP0G1Z4_CLALP
MSKQKRKLNNLQSKNRSKAYNKLKGYIIVILCACMVILLLKSKRRDVSLTAFTDGIHKMKESINLPAGKALRKLQAHAVSIFGYNNSISENINNGALCENGKFLLTNMTSCHPWLDCTEINTEIALGKYFGKDLTKKLQYGIWRGYNVAVQHPVMEKGKDRFGDFNENLRNYIDLQSRFVPQLVGFCNVSKSAMEFGRSYIVTEYYPRRSLGEYVRTIKYRSTTAIDRFQLAISYLEVLLFMHSQPQGPRILCDSNSLDDTLAQFLVTESNTVVLSDLDDIPLVQENKGKLARCKHQDLLSNREDIAKTYFLAPEQVKAMLKYLPNSRFSKIYGSKNTDNNDKDSGNLLDSEGRLPPYLDEKADVYKIPDVTQAILLLNIKESKLDPHKNICIEIWNSLKEIHSKCKEHTPLLRPNVKEILKAYADIIINKKDE